MGGFYEFEQDLDAAKFIKDKASSSNYFPECYTPFPGREGCSYLLPSQSEYTNKQYIIHGGHGWVDVLGGEAGDFFTTDSVPYLNPSFVHSFSCGTNSFFNLISEGYSPSDLISTRFLRKGAIAYQGTVESTWGCEDHDGTLSPMVWSLRKLTENEGTTLGEGFTSLLNEPQMECSISSVLTPFPECNSIKHHFSLLGDPTLVPNFGEITW